MPSDKIKRSNPSRESDSRTEIKPIEADQRDIVYSHIATVIPAAAWITFDESDLNDAAGVDLGPASHLTLLDALDQYRAVQSIPPLPPFSEIEKRLSRLAKKPDQFEKILQIKYGEYPDVNERRFGTCRDNVNYHLSRLLLAAGAEMNTPPSQEQISHALANAQFLHRAARPNGDTTVGRFEEPGLKDLMADAVTVQKAAGGTGPAWHWNPMSEQYEGFLFPLITFLLKANLLIEHLEVFHGAAPPPEKTVASTKCFDSVEGLQGDVLSESTVRRYWKKLKR